MVPIKNCTPGGVQCIVGVDKARDISWLKVVGIKSSLYLFQVVLINAVRDVAKALAELISATKCAAGKAADDPSMYQLKSAAKVCLVEECCVRVCKFLFVRKVLCVLVRIISYTDDYHSVCVCVYACLTAGPVTHFFGRVLSSLAVILVCGHKSNPILQWS